MTTRTPAEIVALLRELAQAWDDGAFAIEDDLGQSVDYWTELVTAAAQLIEANDAR